MEADHIQLKMIYLLELDTVPLTAVHCHCPGKLNLIRTYNAYKTAILNKQLGFTNLTIF